jgi:hypothetical protein
MDHAITVGDLVLVGTGGLILLIAFLIFVVVGVNMGWLK